MGLFIENATISSNQESFFRHEEKVLLLETLGDLIGCTRTFTFCDGTIPDVVRINDSQSLLFIGDAKESETPRNKHTQERLYNYLSWLRAYLFRPQKYGVFAICFRNVTDLREWVNTVLRLAKLAHVRFLDFRSEQIDEDTNLLWFYLSS